MNDLAPNPRTWDIDIEVRMRTTLRFSGPRTEIAARNLVGLILGGQVGDIALYLKQEEPRLACPMPVQSSIDNDPKIVAVRLVQEGDGDAGAG